jgi:hypothetical protein
MPMLKQKVYLYVQAPHHEDTLTGDNTPVQWFSNWVPRNTGDNFGILYVFVTIFTDLLKER